VPEASLFGQYRLHALMYSVVECSQYGQEHLSRRLQMYLARCCFRIPYESISVHRHLSYRLGPVLKPTGATVSIV
jgi:hypothetical protein